MLALTLTLVSIILLGLGCFYYGIKTAVEFPADKPFLHDELI